MIEKVQASSIHHDHDGNLRVFDHGHQNRVVRFQSRSKTSCRVIKKISNFFLDDRGLKDFIGNKNDARTLQCAPFQLNVEQDKFWINVFLEEDDPYFAEWTCQILDPGIFNYGSGNVSAFMHSIREKGILRTLFSKFTYLDTYSNMHIARISKGEVLHVCSVLCENISKIVKDALIIWDSYDGYDFPKYESQCAIETRELYFRPGMQYLLDQDFFRKVEYGAEAYYKTPEVIYDEQMIINALNTISKRDLFAIYNDDQSELNDLQKKAILMMKHNHYSVLCGLAGSGKTHTLCSTLDGYAKIGIVCPSHTSRRIIEQRVKSNYVACEVIQYLIPCLNIYKCKKDEVLDIRTFLETKLSRLFIFMEKIDYDLTTLIFEESSMMDLHAVARMLDVAVDIFPNLSRVIFSGDPFQLKSILRGNVLHDLISVSKVPSVHLTENMRSSNALSTNLVKILNSDYDGLTYDESFVMRRVNSVESIKTGFKTYSLPIQEIVDSFLQDKSDGREPHIIAYTHAEVNAINERIIKHLGLAKENAKDLFLKKDLKVIIQNGFPLPADSTSDNEIEDYDDYDPEEVAAKRQKLDEESIHNPPVKLHKCELYVVVDVNVVEKQMVHIKLRVWRDTVEKEVVIKRTDLSKIFRTGYASNSHFTQGAEHAYIYAIAFDNSAFFDRNGLYTTCSRAKKTCSVFTNNVSMKNIIMKPGEKRVSCFHHELENLLI